MNNFEIITRVLSQDNADINKLKTETDKLKTKITSKEDSFIILNTDAFSGLTFGSETTINLEQNIVLNLFNASSTDELYSQIRSYDNKTFVLKPNGNSFTVGGIQYTITACNPCIGKIYDYNGIPTLCLTFLIDTFNSQTALFKFFISANSNTEISGKLTVEKITSNYPEVHHGINDTTFTLTPNTFHVWDKVPSLTLDFGSNIRGVMNEYLFQFASGSTATSLTLPDSIKWANNNVSTIVENTIYRVSILEGLASVLEFSNIMDFDFYNYLTIETLEDNLTATFTNDIEYGIDGKGWIKLNAGDETPPINVGQTLSFRGELTPNSSSGIGTFTISKKCNLKGNCMSMIFGDNAANNFSLNSKNYAFYKLFQNCTNIVNVDSNFLPATTLAYDCYNRMFEGCTSLVNAPTLPVTTLVNECYDGMFRGCTSLTTAPELPATALPPSCYTHMFSGCTSLTTAPALPATTSDAWSYYCMFENCTSLTTAPELFATTLGYFGCREMFKGCTRLVNAPTLHATTLADNCCEYMFSGCTSLTTAPELPATTLTTDCYDGMFQGCASLTQAPELPATTLADWCYQNMFKGCTSLVNAPALPATTLANSCYFRMFGGCTSLVNAPALPATALTDSCYSSMFQGCTSLTKAPVLHATALTPDCYRWMFHSCTSLTQAPELPATTLTNDCYYGMFRGCTSLAKAPELPATTLANDCYNSMFYGCASLTQAPELPATTLAANCYDAMFYNCTKLNYIKMLATDISASNCLNNWVNGVSSTGTFVKNAAMESLPTGNSGIPNGWTVQNAQ